MPWTVMPDYDTHEAAREDFAWDLPAAYNPAVDVLRKHDDPDRTALEYLTPAGERTSYSFRELDERSDRLAAGLRDLGVGPGDRVGVVVPQKPQNPITHLANWKLGALSVPLSVLYGPDAIQYRLADAEATAVVVDPAVREAVDEARAGCPDLRHVIEIGTDAPDGDAAAFESVLADPGTEVDPYDATPDTESAILYTSGSTGPPKGVLHSHALWLGRAAASYNYMDRGLGPDATVWTPADWAWGSALGGTLFATWHHGGTMVAYPREEFDPAAAFELLEEFDVTQSFMPPTALRLLMDVDSPTERYDLSLETIAAAGEPLTPEILDWAEAELDGVAVNEYYGQTELNLVVGNSSGWFETRPGSMGKPLPGYDVAILDPEAAEESRVERLARGETGEIAVRPHDRSVFFDEYLGLPEKTAEKQVGEWFLTGDLAERDAEGYIWFKSRKDDVILTAGYRVGPMEVEEAILDHDDVSQVGVVGVPDETRGEIIKAYVEPAAGVEGSDGLRSEIRELVRDRLAEYEYPREIEFVDELPRTTTGKIRRTALRERD
ncbi:MAG: acyl-CoA synthetase [Halorientalis sp.]